MHGLSSVARSSGSDSLLRISKLWPQVTEFQDEILQLLNQLVFQLLQQAVAGIFQRLRILLIWRQLVADLTAFEAIPWQAIWQ